MEQKTLLKIIVVAVALFFLLESVAMVVIGNPSKNKTVETYDGAGTVEVTVIKYYSYLKTSDYINETLKKDILGIDGVERVEREDGTTVIAVTESKYVFPVYQFLKERGLSTYTKAQVYFPGDIMLGDKKAYLQGGLTIMMEPFVEEGQRATMLIRARVENGKVVGIYELTPVAERKEVVFKGKSEEEIGKKYVILLPWENRTLTASDLGITGESIEYSRNNYVIIDSKTPIVEKKNYVTAIGEGVIIVEQNFTDKNTILQDYSSYGSISFPDSKIILTTNETLENIPFEIEEYWLYRVRVLPENYTYHEIVMWYESPAPLEVGEEVEILMNATVSGSAIISVEE
ncbi:MAG: hypothetical protein QXY05_03125 [Candidatus Anstonellales archaeon]